jgi:hypothetical protein
MENNNVFLYEEGKKIEQLTTRGNIGTIICQDSSDRPVAYRIIPSDTTIGLIEKTSWCENGMKKDFFAIKLDEPQIALTDITQQIPKEVLEYSYQLSVYKDGIGTLSSNMKPSASKAEIDTLKKSGFNFVRKGKEEDIYNWPYTVDIWEKNIDLKIIPSLVSGNTATNTPIVPTPHIQTKPTSLNGTYFYKWNSEEYSIIVKNATEKSFQVEMEASNDDNKKGGENGIFNKQSDGTWLMKLSGDETSDSPECQKSSARLKISNDNFIIQSVDISWECWSGMPPIIKATYKKQ